MVFAPPFFLGLVASLVGRIWRVPVVLNVQDLPIDAALSLGMLKNRFLGGIMKRLEAWTYRRADLVSSISPTMVESLKEKKVVADRLSLVPNWIDLSEDRSAVQKGEFIKKNPFLKDQFVVA